VVADHAKKSSRLLSGRVCQTANARVVAATTPPAALFQGIELNQAFTLGHTAGDLTNLDT
jgi:hypothetical protein